MSDEQKKPGGKEKAAFGVGEAFELEPAPEKPAAPPPPAARVVPGESLLEGFDEDADFDKDPEVERARKTGGVAAPEKGAKSASVKPVEGEEAEEAPAEEPIVTRGLKGDNIVWGIGIGVLIAAVVTVALTEANWFANIVRVLYNGVLQTLLALWASWLLARIEARPMGDWKRALPRLLLCVAAFQFLVSLNLWWGQTKVEEALLATGAYVVLMKVLMRWSWLRVAHVGALQFVMWGALVISTAIHQWATKPAGP